MIKEFQFYHGVVFAALLHHGERQFTVSQFPSSDNASYVLNDDVGIYVKYSTKRMSPWHFSFEGRHKAEIRKLRSRLGRTVVVLVCRDDGVAGITLDEFDKIVDVDQVRTESVRVVRRPREKYTVSGPRGKLPFKIGMTDFCQKVLCT